MELTRLSLQPQFSYYSKFNQLIIIAKQYIEILMIGVAIVGYGLYLLYADHRREEVLMAPRKSDFYFVDYFSIDQTSDQRFRYIPMRVLEVTDTGVLFKIGNIGYTKPVSPSEHVKFDRSLLLRNYYRIKPLFLSHQQLAEYAKSGVIYDARRPKTIYLDGWIVINKRDMYYEPVANSK